LILFFCFPSEYPKKEKVRGSWRGKTWIEEVKGVGVHVLRIFQKIYIKSWN